MWATTVVPRFNVFHDRVAGSEMIFELLEVIHFGLRMREKYSATVFPSAEMRAKSGACVLLPVTGQFQSAWIVPSVYRDLNGLLLLQRLNNS
jgi:hypothetical protein